MFYYWANLVVKMLLTGKELHAILGPVFESQQTI